MQFYPTKLRLSVKGSDRCADGVLVVPLPCPPSVGLHIDDIYTRGSLYVDQAMISLSTHKWTAWCSVIDEEDMTCQQMIQCFVGDWDWTDCQVATPDDDNESGDDQPDDPDGEPDQPKAEREPVPDEKYQEAIKRLTRGREPKAEEDK